MRKINEFIGQWNERLQRMIWLKDFYGKDYVKLENGMIVKLEKVK